jgi:SpoVK/Ycf46/Vps4 family AAA+-type ATPase
MPTVPAIDDTLAHYPGWARALARKYFTKTLNHFVLHGNVRDLVRTEDTKGGVDYVPLRRFLAEDLFAGRDLVIYFDRSDGIHFVDEKSRTDFARALSGYDTLFATDYQKKLPKDPVRVLTLLDNYVRIRLGEGKRVAVVFDYAETLIPMAEASSYSAEDRNVLVALQKWAHDPFLLQSDFTAVLLTENLTDLNRQLVQSPYTAEIEISLPDAAQRRAFLDWALTGETGPAFKKLSDVTPAVLAQNTAGLGYVALRTILADIIENNERLTFEELTEKKKELIEAEAYGLLEFVEADYNLDLVAGHAEAKAHLRAAAEAIKTGRPDVMPMGYLVSGPVGTGKTFMITAFAGEIGVPMVKLKNFRSQWQGVTEGNLEKILTLLRAMNPVAVMIDEADAALGDRKNEGDSGVSSRVFGQIAQAMSDTRYRGKIVWFLVTARPDLMPVDLKRQGRAEEHIALFYPTTREDREELLRVMMKKTAVDLPLTEIPESLLSGERTYSGADMEALLTRAKFRAAAHAADDGKSNGKAKKGTGKVTKAILEEAVADFIPPSYPLQVELQTLAAIMECSSRALLPASFRDLDREKTTRRIEELKLLVGER